MAGITLYEVNEWMHKGKWPTDRLCERANNRRIDWLISIGIDYAKIATNISILMACIIIIGGPNILHDDIMPYRFSTVFLLLAVRATRHNFTDLRICERLHFQSSAKRRIKNYFSQHMYVILRVRVGIEILSTTCLFHYQWCCALNTSMCSIFPQYHITYMKYLYIL